MLVWIPTRGVKLSRTVLRHPQVTLHEGRRLAEARGWDRRKRITEWRDLVARKLPDLRAFRRIVDYPRAIGHIIERAFCLARLPEDRAGHCQRASGRIGLLVLR